MLVSEGEVVFAGAVEPEEVERARFVEAQAQERAVEKLRARAVLRRAFGEKAARSERKVLAAEHEVGAAVEQAPERQLELVEDEFVRPLVALLPGVARAHFVRDAGVERDALAEIGAGEEAAADAEVVVAAAARHGGGSGPDRDVVERFLAEAHVAAGPERDRRRSPERLRRGLRRGERRDAEQRRGEREGGGIRFHSGEGGGESSGGAGRVPGRARGYQLTRMPAL